MPQEPKQRHSRQRQGKRRAKIKLVLPNISSCRHCGNPILPHTVCQSCGYYRDRQVLTVKTRETKQGK